MAVENSWCGFKIEWAKEIIKKDRENKKLPKAIQELTQIYKTLTDKYQKEKCVWFAETLKKTTHLQNKSLYFDFNFYLECTHPVRQQFTQWYPVVEKYLLKNDNENKSVKQLLIELKNNHS